MNRTHRIAFYMPVKPPDHPIPSGDREIGRLIIKALEYAGYEVTLASRHIAYQKRPGEELFLRRKQSSEAEADRLLANYQAMKPEELPQAWFTYHTYWKAPDWLGPKISAALDIPYFTAEACRTGQDTEADWASGKAIVEASIRHASVNFCLKESDRAYLATVLDDSSKVADLPPFIDVDALEERREAIELKPFANEFPVIMTAGMMRPGKKRECFRILGEALAKLPTKEWNLIVAGDGPEHAAIEEQYSFIAKDRIRWTGLITPGQVLDCMQRSDIFAWPGYREPIGMVYLEAQSQGLPVVALNSLGVPSVVGDGETGILTPEDDVSAYADALTRLIMDENLRNRLGSAGPERIRRLNAIEAGSEILRKAIDPFLD